jgi:hypothetical protein
MFRVSYEHCSSFLEATMLSNHDIRIERAYLELDAYDFGGRALADDVAFEASFDGRTLIAGITLSAAAGASDVGEGVFIARFNLADEVVSVEAYNEFGLPIGRRWAEPESLLYRLHVKKDPNAAQTIEDAIAARWRRRQAAPAMAGLGA